MVSESAFKSLSKAPASAPPKGNFWLANAAFFLGVHAAACVGIYYRPMWSVPRATVLLGIVIWQLACFGVTIGYHRLYSHRAFRAALGVRVILAALGSMAFQGSIKVSETSLASCSYFLLKDYPFAELLFDSQPCLQRFTDDPLHDPYAATRGLFFSHMGWIFYKPKYDKMNTINRDDLESDPVVRLQHKYYVPLALATGFYLPYALGLLWNDPSGAFVWGGLVSRLAIWHCTFLVNSLAHWDGLQPYSDENTSRGNLVMAMLTCGEGNHNFHAFPHDFRAGPSLLSWDPSKWIIILLHRVGLATGLRRARNEDIKSAEAWMRLHHHHPFSTSEFDSGLSSSDESVLSQSSSETEDAEWEGPRWDESDLFKYIKARPGRCVVVLDGYAVDVTRYLGEHPGGALLLREYSIRSTDEAELPLNVPEKTLGGGIEMRARDAAAAFHGGLNNHSRAARRRERELRVARVLY